MVSDTSINPEEVKQKLVADFPAKVARKRAKAIVVNQADGVIPEITVNTRTVPGLITMRGCAYAGCKGVILGPTRDVLSITHGPIGCGFYSWLTRRNQTRPPTPEDDNFMTYCLSTDMQESEIVFGGEKKLAKAIEEAFNLFHPKAIAIHATCPVGLIGDDIHRVAREMQEKLGIKVFGFSCEGYKGVSQSAGHHIANNQVFKNMVGTDDTVSESPFRLNLLGEYNIGGDSFVIEDLFARSGFNLISTFCGNSDHDSMCRAHTADLNLVMCHRSINYMADMMEIKYGIPWIKVNFIGASATAKALRKIAGYFDNSEIKERVEKVIAEEMAPVEEARRTYRPRCEGKTAMLFVGGSRSHHYMELFHELGMKTVAAGYEFAHRDDYEGRNVLPTIVVDADSRNIESLKVVPDAARFRLRVNEERKAELKAGGVDFGEYKGMMGDMPAGSITIDEPSHHEIAELLAIYKPDIFCAGIKEKYAVQKLGIPCLQLHSYDYGGPFAGFAGAINFYKEIDRLVNNRVWSYLQAPWQQQPEICAAFGR
jgi:nitrogenase molybdenum-iron protein alpha chain